MTDQRPKEPKFVPRPCAVCGEPNTVEHRCDYPPSNPLLDLAAIRALHDKASQHHEAVDYYSLVFAIRKMLPEIERLRAALERIVNSGGPGMWQRMVQIAQDALRPADETGTTVPKVGTPDETPGE